MQMTVIASPRAVSNRMSHQSALAEGLAKNGIRTMMGHGNHVSTKHCVVWGWRKGKLLRDRGHEVLVMERGYIGDRFAYTSLAWNGLNGHGRFPEVPVDDGTRFKSMASMKPWKKGGDYVLLMGQVPGDASLQGRDMMPWYSQSAMQAQNAYEMPVKFRPHPGVVKRGLTQNPKFTEPSVGTLEEALDGAAIVLTWNSNSSVDAVLAGVPTVTMDKGSMAWEVSAHRIGDIVRPEREKWANRLAWCQWSWDEIISGVAVKPALEAMWQPQA
jgi:hypothetical protein